MALLQCTECGSDVSSAAPACPHCGKPMGDRSAAKAHASPKSRGGRWIGFLVALALAAGFWGWVEGWIPSSWFRTTADLESSVMANMQRSFDSELPVQQLHLRVEHVALVHSGGNQYKGVATIRRNESTSDIPVEVEADNDHIMYRLDPSALLGLTLRSAPPSVQDLTQAAAATDQSVPFHPADASMPIADTRGNSDSETTVPTYDITKYCRTISDTAGGSSQIELACRQQENDARAWVRGHPTSDRVMSYCDRIGATAGGSYQILKACIGQEEGAAAKL